MRIFSRSCVVSCFLYMVIVFLPGTSNAQAPLCGNDPVCTPDPGGSTYAGTVEARALMLNARGHSNPLVARAPGIVPGPITPKPIETDPAAQTIVGSQSYNYTVPILSLRGRTGMDLVLNLYYNSRVLNVDTVNSTVTFNADRDFPSYGFRLDFGYVEKITGVGFVLTEGDGSKTQLTYGPALMLYSGDGRAIQYSEQTGVLTYKDGKQVQYLPFPSNANLLRPIWIKDANGNYVNITYVSGHDQDIYQITDSVGRVVTFNYDSSNRLSSLSMPIHPSGTKTFVNFTWGAPYSSGYSWYNFSGLTVIGFPTAAQMKMLTGCTYPNGAGYRFTYGDWGIINKIELLSSTSATRSYISYDYPLASAGALTDAPTFTHQTTSPDGGSSNNSVWTYATTKNGTGVVTSMAITGPTGATSTTNLDPGTGLMSSTQISDSSATVLRTISYSWTTTGTWPIISNVLAGATTTLNDTGQQSSISYSYDAYANTTDVYEHDFGGALKRHTVTAYIDTVTSQFDPNGPYINRHILDLATQVLVKDGAGSTISRTDMAYDGTSLTSVTGASSHDDTNYGSSFTTRGNLTSVTRYANASAGTGAVTRSLFYDSLGNLITAQRDCCNQEIFNFSSTTQYSAPDSIVRGPSAGPQFTTSYTYNPDNNLLLTAVDENNQTTQYQYDSMNRVTQMTLPPQGGTPVQMNTAYDDSAASPTATSSNTANSAISMATLDGLGHVMQIDTKNGSTVISSVKYVYDHLWQRTQTSNPFAPGDTPVNTITTYDALGRTTQVAPPSGGSIQYSYSGNAVTIIDQVGKQRKNYADALGRPTEVDEPGETFAGTAANGSLSVSGTLQSTVVGGQGATHATGSVTIAGSEQSVTTGGGSYCAMWNNDGDCVDWEFNPTSTVYDTGTVTITVNGHSDTYTYGQSGSSSSIASGLASAINGDSGAAVTASPSGSTVTLTSKATGTAANCALSSSKTYDTLDFSTPSFTTSNSGSTLTGGQNAINGTTVYDTGTVTVTVGSFTASAPYGQSSNSSAAAVATALVSTGSTGLNRSGSPVTASANGASITIAYASVGTAGNVTVTSTSTSTQTPQFSPPSFTSAGTTLSGGKNAYSSGLSNPYATTYTYDVLNNLVAVSQAAGNVNGQPVSGQARSYAYDSLSRLTSSTTPESGTANTYYTTAGGATCASDPYLPCRIQDARSVVKTLAYDGINRPATVQYSDGTPSVTYAYDAGGAGAYALGRLTSITEGSNSQTFTYDNLGRSTSLVQVIDGTIYTTSYGYNLSSQITSVTYPSGRVVTHSVDAIGRPSSIASGGTTYLNGVSYNAARATLGYTLGNGVQAAFTYNDHLQPASLRYYQSGASTDILNLTYDYTTGGSGNNGQIQAVRYYTAPGTEDTTKSEYFNYDAWLRLSSAHTGVVNSTAGTFSLQWAYDRFGNRLSQTLVGGNLSVNQPAFTVDPTTNRIASSGYQYDAAGNLTNDSVNPYTYDGANRLKQFNGTAATYTYFGPLRIKKVAAGTTTVYIYSGTTPIAEYTNGTLSAENIYFSSQLLAVIGPSSTTYYHPDHLSTRAQTNAAGATVSNSGNLPFGDAWYQTGNSTKWKFTSYELDAESALDYAQYRFYYATQGRFTAADPLGGHLENPQSLNRYAYVGGDPVNRTDPTGLLWGGEALCMLDSQGNFTSNCAHFTSDPELTSLFCGGAAPGTQGPSSFCDTACPAWEAAFCGSSGTVLLVPLLQHTQPATYSLGIGLNACDPTLETDPNSFCYKEKDLKKIDLTRLQGELAAITGTPAVCTLTSYVEAAGQPITNGPCAFSQAKSNSVGGVTATATWGSAPANPMGPSAIGLPPIPPRGPFIPPVIPPVTVVPH